MSNALDSRVLPATLDLEDAIEVDVVEKMSEGRRRRKCRTPTATTPPNLNHHFRTAVKPSWNFFALSARFRTTCDALQILKTSNRYFVTLSILSHVLQFSALASR